MRPQAPAPRQSEVEAYVRTCYADLENKIESIVAMAVEEMSSPEPGGSGSAPPSPGAAPRPPVALQRRLEETVEMYDPPADGALPLPEALIDIVEAQQAAAVAAVRQQAAPSRQQRRSSADDAAARAADFQRILDRALSGSAAAGPRHTAPPGTGPHALQSALAGSSKFPGHQSQHVSTNPKIIASLVPREAAAIQRHIQRHNSQQSPPRMGRPPADSNAATSPAILSQRRAKSAPRARATEPASDGRPAYVRLSSYGRRQLEGRSTPGDPEWVVDMRRRGRRMSEGERAAAADRLYREAERRRAELTRKQEAEARRWRDRARSASPGRLTGTWGGTTLPKAAGYDRPRSAGGTGYFGTSGWMHASFVDRQWADATRRLEKQREIEEARRAAEEAPPDPTVYTLKPRITGLATRVQPHSPEQQMLWVAERRGKALMERAKEEEQELKGLCFMPRINQRSREIALHRWAHHGADPRRPWTAKPTVTAPPKYKQYIPEEWLRYGSPTERAERRKQELVDHAVRSLRGTMTGGGGTSGGGGSGMAYGTERYDASAWLGGGGGGSGRGSFAAAGGSGGYGQAGPAPGEFQGNYNPTGYEAAWPDGAAAAPITAAGHEAWPSPGAAAAAAGSTPGQAVVPVAPGDGVAFVQIHLPSAAGTREPPHLQEALSPQQTPQQGQLASSQREQESVPRLPEEFAPQPHAIANPLSLTAAWRSARAAPATARSSGGGSGAALGGASMGGTPPSFSAAITPTVSGGGSGAAVLHQFAAGLNQNKQPARASTSGGGVPGAAAQALRALLQSGLPLQPTLSEALHQALALAEAEDAKTREEDHQEQQEEQLHRELWDLERQQAQLKLAQKEMTAHAQPFTSSVNYYALQQQVQEREAALLRQRQAPGAAQQRAVGKSESQRARYLSEVAAAQAAAAQAQPAGAYYIATNRVQPAGGAAAMLRKGSTSKKGASAAAHRQGSGADSSALDDATILGFLLQQRAATQEEGEPNAAPAAGPWGLAPPGVRRSSAGGLTSSPSAPPPTEPYSRAQIVNALRRSTSGGMDSGRSGASSGSGAGAQRASPSQAGGAWQQSATTVAALRGVAAPSGLQACDSSFEMASEGQQVVSKAAVDAALFGTRLETISGPYEMSDSPRVPSSATAGTPASLTVRAAAWGPGQRTGSRGAKDASRDIEAGLMTASAGTSRVASDPASLMEVVVDAPSQPAAAIADLLGDIGGEEGAVEAAATKADAAEQPPAPGSPKQAAAGPPAVRAFAARLSKLFQPAAAAAAAAAEAAPDMIVFSPAPAAAPDSIPAGPLAVASGPVGASADQSEASPAATDAAAVPVATADEVLGAPPRSRATSIEAQLSSCLFDEQLTPDARARIMADVFRRSMGGAAASQGVVEALVQTAELLTSAAAAAPGADAKEAAIAAVEALERGHPQAAATEAEASAEGCNPTLQKAETDGADGHQPPSPGACGGCRITAGAAATAGQPGL